MFVLIRLHTEDYKTKDLGVISNYIKLGTGFNRERNASCYKETNLKIRKWHNPTPPGHTHTHTHTLTHSLIYPYTCWVLACIPFSRVTIILRSCDGRYLNVRSWRFISKIKSVLLKRYVKK